MQQGVAGNFWELRASVLQPQELNSVSNLTELGKGLQGLNETEETVNMLISVL